MRTLLLLLISCAAAVAQPTATIAGRIVDDLGDPLPGANVVVEGTQLEAATDIDGNFFISGIPAGEYEVTAYFVDLYTQTVSIELSPEASRETSLGYSRWLDFELGPPELGYWRGDHDLECDSDSEWFAYGWAWAHRFRDPFASRVISGEDIECLPIER